MVRLLETMPYLRKSLSDSDRHKIILDENAFLFRESITSDITILDCEKYVHDVSLQSSSIACETQLFIFP